MPESEPLRPILIVSPVDADAEGSPTRHISSWTFLDAKYSAIHLEPHSASPSSSLVISHQKETFSLSNEAMVRSVAASMAAMPVFISAAPRPYNLFLLITGLKGGDFHLSRGPGGTTSVWPLNAK